MYKKQKTKCTKPFFLLKKQKKQIPKHKKLNKNHLTQKHFIFTKKTKTKNKRPKKYQNKT